MPAEYRLHRRVIDDIKEAESYYLQEGGLQLADKFLMKSLIRSKWLQNIHLELISISFPIAEE